MRNFELLSDFFLYLQSLIAGLEVEPEYPWQSLTSTSDPRFLRSNIDYIKTDKLVMLHCCIFPKQGDPIFGFDCITGKSKATGLFLDFSPCVGNTVLDTYWSTQFCQYQKKRQLPDWAQSIFSQNMVAAGNLDSTELYYLLDFTKEVLSTYLKNIDSNTIPDIYSYHEKYCRAQRENPHTLNVLKSLGFEEKLCQSFISNTLFPY